MSSWKCALVLTLLSSGTNACASAPVGEPELVLNAAGGPAPRARLAPYADTDHDGLCDVSEAMLGTDPTARDTDHDGFPDVVEAISEFDASDPLSPGVDQVVFLLAQAGQRVQAEINTTIIGNGAGATGQFDARNAYDENGFRARDFFVDAVAVEALPPDNARGIVAQNERFTSVSGKTRLTFRLTFAFDAQPLPDCAAALPFDYQVKGDVGAYLGSRSFMLVVTPVGSPRAVDYCQPAECI